ncbi:hypothetical protein WA1_49525 [Scytonema hofmannii PCC 7110]|uniref:HNH nuclease domain-containing protein n=1 Tax=Scytonema hofmannii PCC 7110 TaxID=128403 RepID=A0A139WQS1_9CYAN|nr:GUN4 domain-containing protein [Scytonema hofmannii]KYC34779.1 hypothetical protein WA1_49525 [Scytonema hofmannii PCC 7110]
MSEFKLISDTGIDYTHLQNFLLIKNWLKADDETARLIFQFATDKNITSQDIANIPCEDLQIIDQLWMYYSDKYFGFSIQTNFWDVLIKEHKKANFLTFSILSYKLGWFLEEGWLNYETKLDLQKVPKGHFPRWGFGIIPITSEVTWTPGIMGLRSLSAYVRILGYGADLKLFEILPDFGTISPLENLFARIKTCDLVNTTANGLPTLKQRLEQNLELQAVINQISITSEISEIDTKIDYLESQNYYTPKRRKVFRKRIITSIAQRRGQPLFRKALLNAYNYCCAMSGCNAQEALEAAHIIPYCKTEDNNISNGLLLRADLHTLFDLNLIAIDPKTMQIRIAPSLLGTSYEKEIHNKFLQLPINKSDYPSTEALIWRCNQCNWYNQLYK